jgi:hypothetical protein
VVHFPAGSMFFSSPAASRPALGAQPASYPIGTRETISAGVKRPGRETDHSHLVPEDKRGGAIPPLPHMSFGVVLN